VFAKFDS